MSVFGSLGRILPRLRLGIRLCNLATLRPCASALKILRGYRLEPYPKDSIARREINAKTLRRKAAEKKSSRLVVYNLAVENRVLNLSELNLLRSDKQIAIPDD